MSDFVFNKAHRFSIAPMIDYTDSTFRRMARVMSKEAMLYTEMIAADAIFHGRDNLLKFNKEEEGNVVLQLGGSDYKKLAFASKKGYEFGYCEINLNAGCPSDKVQSGNFGACLMKTPQVIADCYKAMQDSVPIPVSVKTRIGVDLEDSFDFTYKLIETIYKAGCRHIILHARKAWLTGLSPKENRQIPPLDYNRVYEIKKLFKDLYITINGGILTIDDCKEHLQHVDGVMLGRAIIDTPYILASVDNQIFDKETPILSRDEVMALMIDKARDCLNENIALHHFARHLLGMYNSCKNARQYRRYLSENMNALGADENVIVDAMKKLQY